MAHEGKQRKIIVLLADWQRLGGGVWPETRMSLVKVIRSVLSMIFML
jgi:hypothetical protein